MNKFAVVLATVASLGLAIPTFAQEKNDAQVPPEKMGKQDKLVVHNHHHHHHHYYMMVKPEAKPRS
jgi:hypothetical protein